MQKMLKKEEARNTVSKLAHNFYMANKESLKHNLFLLEDFKQEVFARLLSIKVDVKLYTEAYLIICAFSKMVRILKGLRKPYVPEKSYVKVFSVNDFPELNYLKNLIEDELSFKQAFIIINRVFNEYTYKEIAKELGCTSQNVKYHYKKGLEKLEQRLRGVLVSYE